VELDILPTKEQLEYFLYKINTSRDKPSDEGLNKISSIRRYTTRVKTSEYKSTRETQDLVPRFRFTKNPTSSLRGSQRTGSLSTLSSLKESSRYS
jgi:hypothetical protein